MRNNFRLLLCFAWVSATLLTNCMFKPISKTRGIIYDKEKNLKLDIYAPKKVKQAREVLVFIHGGNWRAGKRSLYRFFGKGMAKNRTVCVVIDYRLSDVTNYEGMAEDAVRSIKWVNQNISSYHGDPGKIFVSGHSAGGHLAALVALDESYFKKVNSVNPIKGVVLIDAFGLDMYSYLSNSTHKRDSIYFPTFSKDPEAWKRGSPIRYVRSSAPDFLIFVGGNTFPAIKKGSADFSETAKKYKPSTQLITVKNKKHIPMIGMFYNQRCRAYKQMQEFMRRTP
jgi:acetyl esterase/lipase